MSLVSNWRLKVLALILAVGLLAAVAFSENPVTVNTVQARIEFSPTKPDLVLVNPLPRAGVTVVGPSGIVKALSSDSVKVTANVSKISHKGSYTVTGYPVVSASGVGVQSGSIAIPVTVEDLITTQIDVDVRATAAPGWTLQPKPQTRAICGNATQPCRVNVTAPQSVTQDLKAYIQVNDPFNTDSFDFTNLTIKFEQAGRPIDLTRVSAEPRPGFDPVIATAHVEAKRGSASKTVALLVSVTGRPACGYRVSNLDINQGNGFATLTGPSDAITKLPETLQMTQIDITGATAAVVSNQPIPVPAGVTSAPTGVRIVVSIDRQFDCTAPTPAPTPVPSPSASPSPR